MLRCHLVDSFPLIPSHSISADIPLKYPAVIVDIAVDQEYIRIDIETYSSLSFVGAGRMF
jgi:hypothetical protein